MPLIRLNAIGETPRLHRSSLSPQAALARADDGQGPVVVMIHGYKFKPDHIVHCPHTHILSYRPKDGPFRPPSWPRQLGFGVGDRGEGLAIAFGWDARGAVWQAQRRAWAAGVALAKVISHVLQRTPRRRVHVVAHSMGIELALEALHHLPPGAVDRILSLTGASYHSRVAAALETPAGRGACFINVTSRENDAFDFMYEWLIPAPQRGDRTIGHGLNASNALTLQLDCPGTLEHLARLGSPVAPPQRRICHWSSYTRPGILRFYNTVLREPDRYCLNSLRGGLPPTPSPRWSRLLAVPDLSGVLPSGQKAA